MKYNSLRKIYYFIDILGFLGSDNRFLSIQLNHF